MKTAGYVNETEYHQWFIDRMGDLPPAMKSTPDAALLVWGHEVGAHDAGRGGGNGSIDLLTLDEGGRVWMIEAKMHSSAELPCVWQQLRRYRDAMTRMTWPQIEAYTQRFLQGREVTHPAGRASYGCHRDLLSTVTAWQQALGRATMPADELVRRVAEHFEHGTFGLAVLTDSASVTPCTGYEQECAWVQAHEVDGEARLWLQWHKPAGAREGQRFRKNADDFYTPTRYPRCTPETLALELVPEARPLLAEVVLPRLSGIESYAGLVVKKGAKSSKSVAAKFKVGGQPLTVLDLGWSDTDARRVKREHKQAGQFAMKVNLHLHSFVGALPKERQPAFKALMEQWAPQFHALGWVARAKGRPIITGAIAEANFRSWHKEMEYQPSGAVKDFIGRAGDAEALNHFFDLLPKFLSAAEVLFR